MSREDDSIVDWDEARRLTGGDEALLDELIEVFPAEAEKHMSAIRAAIGSADTDTLVRAAHTLKSSAKLFGAARLADRALIVETLGRTSALENAAALLADLDSELKTLLATLGKPRPERTGS